MKPKLRAVPPDPLEALCAALALKLGETDIADEMAHAELRQVVQLGPESMHDAAPSVVAALEAAARMVPPDTEGQRAVYATACKKLRIRRIDEQLAHVARSSRLLGDIEGEGEDLERLQAERVELLKLRRAVLSEGAP